MIKYYIENDNGEFITKPGSGYGGWTRDWKKAWAFCTDQESIDCLGLIGAWSVKSLITRLYRKDFKITQHDMVPVSNDPSVPATMWRCAVTHYSYDAEGRMYSMASELMNSSAGVVIKQAINTGMIIFPTNYLA